MRRVIALTAAVVCSTSGCLSDHRDDAERLDQLIKTMPGVAGTEMRYESSFENGQNLNLTARLDNRVTEQQAVEVGRTFVELLQTNHLGGHRTELDIRYPATPQLKSNYLVDYSQATFKLGDNASPPLDLSAADVGASTAAWLRAVHFPIAEYVDLSQPTSGGPARGPDIFITLKPGTPNASARALQRSDQALANTTWRIMNVVDQTFRPQEYTSTPNPPSDSDTALWRQITELLGSRTDVSGSTHIPAERGSQAETEIEAGLPSGPNAASEGRLIAMSIADLVRQFNRPVELTLHSGDGPVRIIVGGCERHEPNYRRPPLEVEMSRIYENC
ncbi:hypothetical protein [Mycobacterium sp.]|uniref:hypothetical protein n=1 Tax=Mycobacterium sp. TaxID=1785 RepID=UPI0025E00F0E|nr:hypothetical protein [Mycobacterium sp.]